MQVYLLACQRRRCMFSRLLDERPAPEKKHRTGESGPGLILGLDDLFAAYRRIPNADSRRYGIVGVCDISAGRVMWHESTGQTPRRRQSRRPGCRSQGQVQLDDEHVAYATVLPVSGPRTVRPQV